MEDLLFLFVCYLYFLSPVPSEKCPPTYFAGNGSQPPVTVQFPFGDQFHRCGYPGFNLTSDQGQSPFISLPLSGNFNFLQINYSAQIISVSDPKNCLPNRILTLNLTGSPFSGAETLNYTFLNCSERDSLTRVRDAVPVACLSGQNFNVYMTSSGESAVKKLASKSGHCRLIKSVLAPAMSSGSEISTHFNPGTTFMQLTWNVTRLNEKNNDDGDTKSLVTGWVKFWVCAMVYAFVKGITEGCTGQRRARRAKPENNNNVRIKDLV